MLASWTCRACTLINTPDTLVCTACASHFSRSAGQDGFWTCSACTLLNEVEAGNCTACLTPAPAAVASKMMHLKTGSSNSILLEDCRLNTGDVITNLLSDGWLIPNEGEPISSFLERAKPSHVTVREASWISVAGPRQSREVGSPNEVMRECELIKENCLREQESGVRGALRKGEREILQCTQRHGTVIGGKWLVYAAPRDADEVSLLTSQVCWLTFFHGDFAAS